MKLLLCALNAKYIHSNLAVYSLMAYAKGASMELKLAEYTINNRTEEILKEIYREKADIVAFSCYIWNIEQVYELVRELHKVAPHISIWLGGPEVSYDAGKVLREHPEVTLVMMGEGEETFRQLTESWGTGMELSAVDGIAYRQGEEIHCNAMRPQMDMDKIPFIYEDLDQFKNKIIYYETSRGCPFSCSYCLSSIDKRVRFRSFSLVQKELKHFLDHDVKQVKFVDRTFNCNHKHAMEIWEYITKHDNGITNFHFEVSADLLKDEDIQLFERMRPGLIQLEIGVQSTYQPTIGEIRRTMDLEALRKLVARVKALGNIHQHLDLIAGLPLEDYGTFKKSFDEVFSMQPDQLQLGFLKVLKGSYMHEKSKDYEIAYRSRAPYEVLKTKWLSYDEILKLKEVEEMVELYYNSAQYTKTLPYLLTFAKGPYAFFRELATFYYQRNRIGVKHSRLSYYELLREFALFAYPEVEEGVLDQLLMYDLYLRENIKKRPQWGNTQVLEKKAATRFYRMEGVEKYFPQMQPYDSKLAAGNSHVERFFIDVDTYEKKDWWALFDYHTRNPLTYDATVREVKGIEDGSGKSIGNLQDTE